MKAEHRHDLKTNELAEWIANLPQWLNKNLRTIIYASVVLILIAGSYIYHRYQKNVISVQRQTNFTAILTQLEHIKSQIIRAQQEGLDISYNLIQMANDLQTIAQETKNNQTAALAMIKRAEALRTELHYRPGTIKIEDLTAQINVAKDSYNKAINKASDNPSLQAMAKLGLGLCEEELGNFTAAQNIYRDIVANPNFESTLSAAQAKLRLDTMAAYQQPVAFKTFPMPAPVQATQPSIQTVAEPPPPDAEPSQ